MVFNLQVMKAYYYFLFRIYKFYQGKMHEGDGQALLSATAVSTTIISINLFSLVGVLDYFNLVPMIDDKHYVILIMIIIGIINHFFFVRGKEFLSFDFKKDKKGGALIVTYLVLTFVFTFVEGQYNREKIFKERAGTMSNEPRKESLEGKIREWFEQ